MEEKQKKAPKQEKETIKTQMKLFMFHLFTFTPQQHTDLINSFFAFLESFGDTDEYKIKANSISKFPVKWFIKNNEDYFSKERRKNIDEEYSLSELDWAYYRSIVKGHKLSKEYESSSKAKRRFQKKISLAQIINILGFVRRTLYKDLSKIASEYGLEVPLELPTVARHDNVGVGIIGENQPAT